jgi:ABC-type lipoprotein release transport system permease subunit
MQPDEIEGRSLMKLIFRIAFRNLFRRKGRSLLMGLGICLSMMIMVIGYSFSKGISLNVINKLVDINIIGHIAINGTEKTTGSPMRIIRDKDSLATAIKKNLKNVKSVREALSTSAYAVGNGNGDMVHLVGVSDSNTNIMNEFSLVKGDFAEFENRGIENPLILEYRTTEKLKVKPGDVVQIRLNTIYGQVQTARLTLVATVESKNMFIGTALQGALPLSNLKEILGYRSDEAQNLNIVLDNIDESKIIATSADFLHDGLSPETASIQGKFFARDKNVTGTIAGLLSDGKSIDVYRKQINAIDGDLNEFSRTTVLMGKTLAIILEAEPGTDFAFSYQPKFEDEPVSLKLKISAIIEDPPGMPFNFVLIPEKDFYGAYLNHLPEKTTAIGDKDSTDRAAPLWPALAPEWKLAKRTHTLAEVQQKKKEIKKEPSYTPVVDVASLKEEAENLFKIESAINLVSSIAMVIVFVIILVGVVNSVRMNIRERTREIGTIRALGMQKSMLVRSIVTEVFLLSIFSVLLGIILSYVFMNLLSLPSFPIRNNDMAAFLNNGHLQFIPPIRPVVINAILLILFTTVTTWFPAKKAANMPVAEALGHYE